MELKQCLTDFPVLLRILLIVPYGIETRYRKVNQDVRYLLIVPYGIETM